METGDIITYFIAGLSAAAVYYFANKAANREVQPTQQGQTLLKMNPIYKYLGLLACGLAILSFAGPVAYPEEGMWPFVVIMVILFGGLGFLCLRFYYNIQVLFDEEKISSENARGQSTSLFWHEIEKISKDPFSGSIIFRGKNAQIKAHQHLVGLRSLVNMLETKTSWKAKDLGMPGK